MTIIMANLYYMQVLWLGRPECETTWEQSSVLSASLGADYEAGLLLQTSTESQTAFGHTSTILVTKGVPHKPVAKKVKKDCLGQADEG